MQIEYEVTFPDIDKDIVREKLERLGAEMVHPEFLQKRINFNLPKESPLYHHGWIRIRQEYDKITMSVKAVTDTESIEGQKEVCLTVEDFEEARSFIESMGPKVKAYQESKRELWKVGNVEVCIDEWPWLPPFVEVEGPSEAQVRDVAEKLGFEYDKGLFGAVDIQYKQHYKVSSHTIANETPRFVFGEGCPFEGK